MRRMTWNVLILLFATSLAPIQATGQVWYGTDTEGIAWRPGNVAIGGAWAGKKLHIHTGGALGSGDGVWLQRDNSAGIHALGILANMAGGSFGPMTQSGDFMILLRGPAAGDPQAGLVIAPWGPDPSGLRIAENGHVGIGTPNPGSFRLAVNGSVRAKEVVVNTGWADFVFEDDYPLPSLDEVHRHIEEHGYLPDMPPAEEVERDGIGLGELQVKLLQKIEELTLYMIDLHGENRRLHSDVKALEAELRNEVRHGS